MPPFMINFTLEEVAYVTVDCSSWDIVHCFERFGGDPIEAWCFPFLQLVDGSFDFSKTMGLSITITIMHGFCSRRLRTERSTGRWLFITLSKCIPNTDMFSFAFDASFPFSRRMDMLWLVLWGAVSTPVRIQIFFHASRGSMFIS